MKAFLQRTFKGYLPTSASLLPLNLFPQPLPDPGRYTFCQNRKVPVPGLSSSDLDVGAELRQGTPAPIPALLRPAALQP